MSDTPLLHELPPLPSGGRRVPRPESVQPCPRCGQPSGLGYLTCPACHDTIERYWLADWAALLGEERIDADSEEERTLAQVIWAEVDSHAWTIVDRALTLIPCDECGSELGGGPKECPTCKFAFERIWWYDYLAGQQGRMTMNEHALRVGRWIVRYPHRYSQNIVTGWSTALPRILTGWLPSTEEAQRGMARLRAGKAKAWDDPDIS